MSRRRRTGITILVVLAAAFLFWLDHGVIKPKRQAPSESNESTKAYDLEKYHARTFTVVNVVDGDTIDIDAADGTYDHTRIRLWGIDTPETKNPETGVMYFGPEAAEFTRKLALEKQVTIYLDESRTRDKYNRLLAYVKLQDGGFLNEVLLTEGFAYADLRFKHDFYNKYKQLEAIARTSKKGLWEGVTYEQLPKWLQREKTDLLKKRSVTRGLLPGRQITFYALRFRQRYQASRLPLCNHYGRLSFNQLSANIAKSVKSTTQSLFISPSG